MPDETNRKLYAKTGVRKGTRKAGVQEPVRATRKAPAAVYC